MSISTNFEIFIIKTLPREYFENCKNSLLKTSEGKIESYQIQTINEKDTREKTLNAIIAKRNKDRDLFIVADDVVFRKGWYEALTKNHKNGDIIGFSMIDAKSGLLQDFGYDFIFIDNELSYRGLYKHDLPDKHQLPDFRYCDAVTGCAMYIKHNVLENNYIFPKEGYNRWGETIFCHVAKQDGYRIIVLSAFLKHYGISTKQKTNKKLSSISWLIERELWQVVVKNYLHNAKPLHSYESYIGNPLTNLLESSSNKLIYGCGTIANAILNKTSNLNIDVCSGLSEEVGLVFHGKKILNVRTIEFSVYQHIIISTIGYEREIIPKYFTAAKENQLTYLKKSENIFLSEIDII